ncbi:MAG: hypothetical protein ABGX71_12510 [Methyloprofundus sp.]|nr:hypothetical protein [Methyloprofundus sp.]
MAVPTCREIHPEFVFAVYANCITRSIGVGEIKPGCSIKEKHQAS